MFACLSVRPHYCFWSGLEIRSQASHEIEWYTAKQNKKKRRHDVSELFNQAVIPRMIDSESLQHGPESVCQVKSQCGKGDKVKQAVKKAAKSLFDQFGDGHFTTGQRETRNVNQ